MNALNALKYIVSAGVLLGIDAVYLSFIQPHFQRQVASIQRTPLSLKWPSTVASYVFLIIALHYFIIRPLNTPLEATLLGGCIYAVFEFTNHALFTKWKMDTVVIDTIWGGVLFGLTTYITYTLVVIPSHTLKTQLIERK